MALSGTILDKAHCGGIPLALVGLPLEDRSTTNTLLQWVDVNYPLIYPLFISLHNYILPYIMGPTGGVHVAAR